MGCQLGFQGKQGVGWAPQLLTLSGQSSWSVRTRDYTQHLHGSENLLLCPESQNQLHGWYGSRRQKLSITVISAPWPHRATDSTQQMVRTTDWDFCSYATISRKEAHKDLSIGCCNSCPLFYLYFILGVQVPQIPHNNFCDVIYRWISWEASSNTEGARYPLWPLSQIVRSSGPS